jgi:HSP20 family molecular chaperone IbpA
MPDETQDLQKREPAVPAEVERQSERQTVLPNVDIIETPEGSVLLADLPGCDQDSLDLGLENGVLTVTARRDDDTVPDHDATYTEYQGADFERSFSVSELIDTEKVDATVKDGVLRVTLPKAEAAKPKKIDIKTG